MAVQSTPTGLPPEVLSLACAPTLAYDAPVPAMRITGGLATVTQACDDRIRGNLNPKFICRAASDSLIKNLPHTVGNAEARAAVPPAGRRNTQMSSIGPITRRTERSPLIHLRRLAAEIFTETT